MNETTLLLCLAIAVIVGMILYSGSCHRREGYDLITRTLPTSAEVELIEGRPNFDVVNSMGQQVIHQGDIALGPAFGIGEGTVGFGRYGSSFMA